MKPILLATLGARRPSIVLEIIFTGIIVPEVYSAGKERKDLPAWKQLLWQRCFYENHCPRCVRTSAWIHWRKQVFVNWHGYEENKNNTPSSPVRWDGWMFQLNYRNSVGNIYRFNVSVQNLFKVLKVLYWNIVPFLIIKIVLVKTTRSPAVEITHWILVCLLYFNIGTALLADM